MSRTAAQIVGVRGAKHWTWGIALLAAAWVFAAVPMSAAAQSAQDLVRTHRFSEALERLRGRTGGQAQFLRGQAHLQRGYALRDIARLQVRIGAAYYTERDTSASARPTPWTEYYATRYRHALSAGERSEVQALLERGGLPSGYSAQARVWAALSAHQSGDVSQAQRTWNGLQNRTDPAVQADLALARWQAGAPQAAPDCGEAASDLVMLRCRLWASMHAENWSRLNELHRRLLAQVRPADEVATFDDYSVRFYDPGTLYTLAIADFFAAAAAFQEVTGARGEASRLLAGIALVQARDHDRARAALRDVSLEWAPTYRIAAQASSEASDWTRAMPQSNLSLKAVWAEEAARDAPSAVQRVCQRVAQNPPDQMDTALRFGRAALRVGDAQSAYRILRKAYPVSQSNNLEAIDPAYLAVFAEAKFQLGRRYSTEVLTHLNVLRDAYPAASIVHDLAQGYYVPDRRQGNVR